MLFFFSSPNPTLFSLLSFKTLDVNSRVLDPQYEIRTGVLSSPWSWSWSRSWDSGSHWEFIGPRCTLSDLRPIFSMKVAFADAWVNMIYVVSSLVDTHFISAVLIFKDQKKFLELIFSHFIDLTRTSRCKNSCFCLFAQNLININYWKRFVMTFLNEIEYSKHINSKRT